MRMRFFIFLFIPLFSYAQIEVRPLIEPYIGYELGEIDFNTAGFGNSATARVYGIRGLLGINNVFIGGDHSAGKSVVEYSDSSLTNSEYDFTDTGLFISYHFNFGLRLWYVNFFSHKAIDQDGDEISGKGGAKYGLGYIVTDYISLNVEQASRKYSEGTVLGAINYVYSSWLFSVGFPFP